MLTLIIALLILALDQWIKLWIERQERGFFPHWVGCRLKLERVHNSGLMLRFLQRRRRLVRLIPLLVLVLFAAIALPELLAMQRVGVDCACGLLLGGALGNVLDRFTRGYVVDWLMFPRLPGKQLPRLAFNIADLAIFAAVLWLLPYPAGDLL